MCVPHVNAGTPSSAMIPARYDLSIPANQAKLEAADALGRLADEAGAGL